MRCVVCGHRHHHCDHCHKAHDRLSDKPIWVLAAAGTGKIIPAPKDKK